MGSSSSRTGACVASATAIAACWRMPCESVAMRLRLKPPAAMSASVSRSGTQRHRQRTSSMVWSGVRWSYSTEPSPGSRKTDLRHAAWLRGLTDPSPAGATATASTDVAHGRCGTPASAARSVVLP